MNLYEQVKISNEAKALTVIKTRKELLDRNSIYELERTMVTVKDAHNIQIEIPLTQLLDRNVYITNISKLEAAIDELEVCRILSTGVYAVSILNALDTLTNRLEAKSINPTTIEVWYKGNSYFKFVIQADSKDKFTVKGLYSEDLNNKQEISCTYPSTLKGVMSFRNKVKTMIR